MKIDDVKVGEVYTCEISYRSGFGRRLRAERIVTQEPERASWRSSGRKQRMVRVTWLEGDDGDTPSDPQPSKVMFAARDLTPWEPWRQQRDERAAEHKRQGEIVERYCKALALHGIDAKKYYNQPRYVHSRRLDLTLSEEDSMKLIEALEKS